jgi:hypothetical protein
MIRLSVGTVKLLVESGLEIYFGPCWHAATLGDRLAAKSIDNNYTWRVWQRQDTRYYIVEHCNRVE